MFSITKAGYAVEHEIKLTKADFKADARKYIQPFPSWDPISNQYINKERRLKLELLAAGDQAGPSRFFYLTPENLVSEQEIPAFAGLIYYIENKERHYTHLHVVRDAPKLHAEPVTARVLDHVNGVFFWRYWNLRNKQPVPAEMMDYSI